MKLAEALMERADVQRRMEQLDDRLRASARTQEGEKPPEAPAALLAELDALAARQELLIRQINLTNSRTLLEGESLTALLARRDAWQKRLSLLRNFLDSARCLTDRASRSEIKIVSTVDVASLQKELDKKSQSLRALDARIQAANWTTDISLD